MNALGYFKLGRRRSVKTVLEPRLRLIMFGFAGGTVTALHSLAEALPTSIEVWGAEYPGRGMRWREKLNSGVDDLLADLRAGLYMLDELPLAFLGYSMGANVAYRLALSTTPKNLCAFIAMSARPPIHQADQWESAQLSDAQLIAKLDGLGGIPAEILNNSAILEEFLPVMRADLSVCADFSHFKVEPLPCPIFMLEGRDDKLLLNANAQLWLDVAGGDAQASKHRLYDGGHFFHKGREHHVAEELSTWLLERLEQTSSAASSTRHTQEVNIASLDRS